jgi:hypothetical protein
MRPRSGVGERRAAGLDVEPLKPPTPFWQTIATFDSECVCGAAINEGAEFVFRYEPRVALCLDCASRANIDAAPSSRLRAYRRALDLEAWYEAVLAALPTEPPGVTYRELAEALGVPPTDIFRPVSALVRDGIVVVRGRGLPGDPRRFWSADG